MSFEIRPGTNTLAPTLQPQEMCSLAPKPVSSWEKNTQPLDDCKDQRTGTSNPCPGHYILSPRLSPVFSVSRSCSGSALALPAQQTRALLAVLIFHRVPSVWFGSTFLRLHNTTIDCTTTVKLPVKFITYLEKVFFSLSNSRECRGLSKSSMKCDIYN